MFVARPVARLGLEVDVDVCVRRLKVAHATGLNLFQDSKKNLRISSTVLCDVREKN
jgi:hypothetical protein